MNKFFLPFSYLFYSRLSTAGEKISWYIIYVIPMLFLSISVSKLEIYQTIGITLLAMTGYIALYEIGYIENDLHARKKEKEPTRRIRIEDQPFFVQNLKSLIFVRLNYVILVILILSVLHWLFNFQLYVWQYVLLLIISRIAFIFHNLWRHRGNIITFALLQITKYFVIPILFALPENIPSIFMILLFIYPFVRTMEYASSKKFEFQVYRSFIGNHDSFRVKYYFILLVLSLSLVGMIEHQEERMCVIGLTIYFLLFRVAVLIAVKKGIYQR